MMCAFQILQYNIWYISYDLYVREPMQAEAKPLLGVVMLTLMWPKAFTLMEIKKQRIYSLVILIQELNRSG